MDERVSARRLLEADLEQRSVATRPRSVCF